VDKVAKLHDERLVLKVLKVKHFESIITASIT
jgi:hypothetical protein